MATGRFALIQDFVDKEKTKEAIRAAYLEHLYDKDGNPVEGIFTESMARAEENEIYSNEDNSRIVTFKNWFRNKIWYPMTVSKAVKHRKTDGEEVELEGFINALNTDLTKKANKTEVALKADKTELANYKTLMESMHMALATTPKSIVDRMVANGFNFMTFSISGSSASGFPASLVTYGVGIAIKRQNTVFMFIYYGGLAYSGDIAVGSSSVSWSQIH